jgi:phospholipid/cholesterol/gamma-HCH transport system substrate-binding protein
MAKVDGTMNNVNKMTERLNSTDNNVGLLLNDTALYGNLNRTATGAAQLVEDLKAHPKRYVHFSVFGKKDKPAEPEKEVQP